MINRLFLILIILVFTGCALNKQLISGMPDIDRVSVGMSQEAVMQMMGEGVVIGYEKNNLLGSFSPVRAENPRGKETLKGDGKEVKVLYYLTHVQIADDIISDDEITPFVFEYGILIGKGWSYLNSLTEQHNLK